MEIIQQWIWNIGGALLTITLFLFLITWIISWCINRLSWWGKKESRENLFYWIKNKAKITKIIEDEKLKER